jgi:hypothetical protein
VRVEQVEMAWLFDTPDHYWRFVMEHAGGLAPLIRALPDEGQAAVRRLTEERLEGVAEPPGYRLPGVCLNVLAR